MLPLIAAHADPMSDAQAVCKTHLIGQNTINKVGSPAVSWPAYNRQECNDLEALINQNVPPDPSRHLNETDVLRSVMALTTGVHPVILSPVAKAACVAQGYANIAAEQAQSSDDAAAQADMAAASASTGKHCTY